MTQIICDVCHREIEHGFEIESIEVEFKSMRDSTVKGVAELRKSLEKTWAREFHVCKYCIIDAFEKLDDRPKQMVKD